MEEAMSAPSVVSWWPRGPEAKLTITSAQSTEQHPMTDRECYEWTQGINLSLPPAVAAPRRSLAPSSTMPKATAKKKDDYKAE
jgi:hypothetical protein